MKVLLVDDEIFAVRGLNSMLHWEAFHGELAGTAANGEEAMEYMAVTPPDVIISDIKMPRMDGLRLAELVHAQSPATRMILLSGHGEFEYARQALKYGVADYILKPITREKVNQIENLLVKFYKENEERKQRFLNAWDSGLEEKILSILHNQNMEALDQFFRSSYFVSTMHSSSANPLGIQLINYLYAYFSQIDINRTVITVSRERAMEQFWDSPGTQEKINFIITSYYDVLTGMNQKKQAYSESFITYAKEYIGEHYSDPEFNISVLADNMHVSLSYLSSQFKQATGSNLISYVTAMRMDYARRLLADRRYSIGEISAMSGYEDAKYFAKLFKKKTGFTPSEYRNLKI
ncbi:response regulator [Hungatella sp. L12]|uniref:Stage 0 sporulation protein A homolog n=1 Tax=Hungatella hominis TaxID=2763050 RepID=A0ABR7HFG2_9FIRM|nr:response regulator [Hungatella hominis]MBC5711922.1 response regulator [Hungatella hominis]